MSGPSGKPSPFPIDAWPTETFDQRRKYMYLNGEGIEVFRQPAAHTDGDAIVFFRRSDVVVAGDVLDTTRFPVIDVAKGGSIQGEIAALQKLVDTAIPSVPIVSREEGTLVIPGHGRLCDQLDVVDYRDMVTIIRDRVHDLMKQGLTLEQVKAASPARGYVRRYGSDTGSWTTNDFVEAIYQTIGVSSAMRVFYRAAFVTLPVRPGRECAGQRLEYGKSIRARGSDGLLGRVCDRGLAIQDDHAAQRRLPTRAHDSGSAQGGRRLGSSGRRSGGQSMQSVWRRGDHAACCAISHYVAGR